MLLDSPTLPRPCPSRTDTTSGRRPQGRNFVFALETHRDLLMQLIGFVGVVSPICFLLLTHFGLGEAGFPFLFGVPTLTKILKK